MTIQFDRRSLGFTNLTDEQDQALAAFLQRDPLMINFGATGIVEIVQNVIFTLTTVYYSVVLDREFGFDGTLVDKPMPIAMLVLPQEIAYKIALYEPRAQFEDITYLETAEEGKLVPRVKCRLLVTT